MSHGTLLRPPPLHGLQLVGVIALVGSRSARGVRGVALVGDVGLREIHVALARLDGAQHLRLRRAARHEVELRLREQRLKLRARLPHHLHVGDVLRRESLRLVGPLRAEAHAEVAQVAQSDLLALQELLAHAVDSQVEDGGDVGAMIDAAVRGDMSGELVDRHHVGILGDGERLLPFGGHELRVGLVGLAPLGLGLLDARFGLVDFEKVRVHAAHNDAVVDHNAGKFFENFVSEKKEKVCNDHPLRPLLAPHAAHKSWPATPSLTPPVGRFYRLIG